MSATEFEQAFSILAEMCNRQTPSDACRKVYFSRLSRIESGELKRAFDVFACRGKWPALAEMMIEVGIVPPQTRQERAACDARAAHEVAAVVPDTRAETETGVWTFRSEADQTQEIEARRILDERTASLTKLGWVVYAHETFPIRVEVPVGNQIHQKRQWARNQHAFRYPGATPEWNERMRMLFVNGATT